MISTGYLRGAWKLILVLAVTGSPQIGSALPDLKVNKGLLRTSVEVQKRSFTTASCDYQERCLTAVGTRKLLKVDVGIVNLGPHDLVIGSPGNNLGLFEFSPCHDHYHMKTMVHYRLLNLNYSPVTRARKQAFCLRDNYPFLSNAGPSRGYHCENQGITAGWQDVYDKSLDCQYVDVTGVPPGYYYLEVTVNPLQIFNESSFANNRVLVYVHIPRLPKY